MVLLLEYNIFVLFPPLGVWMFPEFQPNFDSASDN